MQTCTKESFQLVRAGAYTQVNSERKNSKEGYLCTFKKSCGGHVVDLTAAQVCWMCVSAPPAYSEYLEESVKYLVDLNES